MLAEGRTRAGNLPARVRLRIGALLAVLSAAIGVAAHAEGVFVDCGAVVAKNITLKRDIGPCTGTAITVTGSRVTIDLNGHRVFGSSTPGEGAGIALQNVFRVTVKDGTVSNFDAGVLISNGGQNTISNVKAIANIGLSGTTEFGDGLLVDGSSSNVLTGNDVRSNGPFSGISVIGAGSTGNQITKNQVEDNDSPATAVQNSDVGIRLEAGTQTSIVSQNVIAFSGLDGVSIFQGSTGNVLSGNTIRSNGFHDKTHRKGDGIRVFGGSGPDGNKLVDNVVTDNAGNGIDIDVGATSNRIQKNRAHSNGLESAGSFDLVDENPGCADNAWLRNRFGTRSQNCLA